MKPTEPNYLFPVIAALAFCLSSLPAEPVGSAIAYQGRLSDGGVPATGTYDLEFTLYAASLPTEGARVGAAVTNSNVAVSNGLFNVTIDFGADAFNGDARWLQIGIRTNGSTVDFQRLTPLQELQPHPYALYAHNAGTATVASSLAAGPQSGAFNLTNAANAVVGTFTGNGSGLTGLNPAAMSPGTAGIDISGNAATATTAASAATAVTAGSATNFTGPLAGDVTGSQGATFIERIRGVQISSNSPSMNQFLRYDGSQWVPGGVALETDVVGTLSDARLSRNVALLGGNQTFGGSNTFWGVSVFTNAGNSFVGAFAGDGSSLSNVSVTAANFIGLLPTTQLSGALPADRLAGSYGNPLVFDNPANTFIGSGAGLTDLNASKFVDGTLSDARLSSNVALLNAHQTFSGSNIFGGVLIATNTHSDFRGTFAGDGGGLTGLNPANLSSGKAGIDISGNAATATAAANAITAASATTALTAGSAAAFTGSLAGDVSGPQGATSVERIRGRSISPTTPASNQFLRYDGSQWVPGGVALASDVDGTLSDSHLSSNVGLVNADQTFRGSNRFSGVVQLTNATNTIVGTFSGDGAGLRNLTVSIANVVGPIPVTQLIGPLPANLIVGTYTNPVIFNNPANSFAGNGGALTNVDAERLSGRSASDFWQLGGNAGTAAGVHFLGTTDGQALEFKVDGQRAYRLEPTAGAPNMIGGSSNSFVETGAVGVTISGGDANSATMLSSYSSIGGGIGNLIGSSLHSAIAGGAWNEIFMRAPPSDLPHEGATIGGGVSNSILSKGYGTIGGGRENVLRFEAKLYNTIGGGYANMIYDRAENSTIAGGIDNLVNGASNTIGGGERNVVDTTGGSTIAGGQYNRIGQFDLPHIGNSIGGGASNRVTGSYSVIPGGFSNNISASYSFAAGRRANAPYSGSFVWADSSDADFVSTSSNQFLIRASGGVGIGTASPVSALHVNGVITATAINPSSDRNTKEHFAPVDSRAVLEKVTTLPIESWNYKQDPSVRHIGPMAQDFYAAFATGSDDKHIATVDADGVALAAIQGLNEVIKEKDARIQALEKDMAQLRVLVNTLAQKSNGGEE